MFASGLYGYLADYLIAWGLFLSLVIHTWCFFRFYPPQRHPKLRLLLGNGLVLLCMLGAAGLIGESYYRFVCVETDSFGLTLPARRWFVLYTRLNSMGCRDHEWKERKQRDGDVYRIAFVGDSFTYGWGIENPADRFTDRLQARFNARRETSLNDPRHGDTAARAPAGTGEDPTEPLRYDPVRPPPVEVMNVAKPGWGTGDQIEPVRDLIERYGVNEVVLCYVPNDIEKLIPRRPGFDPLRPPTPVYVNLSTSALLEHLYYRIVVPRAASVAHYHDWLAAGFSDETVWRRHQQQLYTLVRMCRERGVRFRAVLLPFLRTGGVEYDEKRIHDMLRRFFEDNGVEVADLLPVIAGRDPADLVVSPFDAHPNERAHALFAEAIWKVFYRENAAPPQVSPSP